jgi:hypothetical protein
VFFFFSLSFLPPKKLGEEMAAMAEEAQRDDAIILDVVDLQPRAVPDLRPKRDCVLADGRERRLFGAGERRRNEVPTLALVREVEAIFFCFFNFFFFFFGCWCLFCVWYLK